MSKQRSGCVTRVGDWWVVRFREQVQLKGELRTINRAKRLVRVSPEHKTKRSVASLAERELAIQRPRSTGPQPIRANMKLGEFVESLYWPYIEKSKRPSTLCGYRKMWSRYFEDRCSDFWIRDITTGNVENWLCDIASEYQLSRETLSHESGSPVSKCRSNVAPNFRSKSSCSNLFL